MRVNACKAIFKCVNVGPGLILMKLLVNLNFLKGIIMSYAESKNQNYYILGVGEKDAQNLDSQHEMLKENSIHQLKKAGLREGMVVWDIGCGNGTMTEVISSAVGQKGHVYAIDISKEQIGMAQKRIEKAGLNNVTFKVSDIDSLRDNQYKNADIIYSRLFFMHLKNPLEAIKIMVSLLKEKGGVISLQESSVNSTLKEIHEKEIDITALKRYYELITTYGKTHGFDYDIGNKLQSMSKELNLFSEIDYYTSHYCYHEHKQLVLNRYDELKDKAIEAGLMTKEEFKDLREKLHDLFSSKEFENLKLKLDQHHLLLTYKNRP
jgi:ubiquinone/menaquinone biosynthesis C-methylase UbiE